MTDSVAAQTPVTEHVGNGVTTSFACTFQLLNSADLVVELDGVVQTSGYTVSGVGVLAGGSVLFTTAPASDVSVLLRRSTDLSRSTSYTYAGDLRETVVDEDFNRLWHAMQERAEVETRALRAPVGETLDALPPASQRASTQLLFDDTGEPYCGAPVSGSAADVMLQFASTAPGKGAALVGVQGGGTIQDAVDAFVYVGSGSDDTATLVARDAAATAAGQSLILKGAITVSASITFTSLVRPSPGSRITTSGGAVTLDFAAGFMAGRFYCIDSTGPVVLDTVSHVIPEWFGAVVNGTDCTTAMQRAHATGRPVHYGRGSYWFTSISIANGGIYGCDRERTFLYCTDTSASNAITVTATLPTVFSNFQLGCVGTKTGGIGLLVDPGASLENNKLRISDVTFTGFKHHIDLQRCVYYDIARCSFHGHTTAAVTLANPTNPDGGDGNISECKFFGGASGFSIIWRSGGGLRISRNKLLDGANAIYINADLPSSTSDIFIEHNSIENQTSSGIAFARASGTGGIKSISISGNQFDGVFTPIQGGGIPAAFISHMQVVNNQFQLLGGTGVVLTNVVNPTVLQNQFVAASGSPTGINIAASCSDGLVGPNTFHGTFSNKVVMASGTTSTLGSSGTATVASASAISLPTECDLFLISGTTSITSIVATGWAGRTVRLIFQAALTLTDGSNLKLASNFVTTADDTLTLACDGTNWYESARSIN